MSNNQNSIPIIKANLNPVEKENLKQLWERLLNPNQEKIKIRHPLTKGTLIEEALNSEALNKEKISNAYSH